MKRLFFILSLFTFQSLISHAQQFPGLSSANMPSVCFIPFNPAFVVKPEKGLEFRIFSASVMVGTNAYSFKKDYFAEGMQGGAIEGKDYFKDQRNHKKHIWGNIDILGPSVSFTYKDDYHFGLYTRVRQITRGGNVDNRLFDLLGDMSPFHSFPDTLHIENAGFTSHVFGEVGFTYGRLVSTDLNNVYKIGFTLKYVKGIAAGALFTPKMDYVKHTADSTNKLSGDLTAFYTQDYQTFVDKDPGNDFEGWMNQRGGGSLGFDIGFQYEYHPYADPNKKPFPYLYRISAAITDIGTVPYKSDTASGVFKVNIKNKANWQFERSEFEEIGTYLERLENDTLIARTDSAESFRIGLPTALRLNADLNIGSDLWLGVNVVLNMRGDNGDVFRPGYVNMLNITPRFEKNWFMIGLPFSFWGYQTFSIGTVLRAGPLFVGSTTILSSLLTDQLRNLDGYAGLSFRIPEKQRMLK
jgi:hypothetical protein